MSDRPTCFFASFARTPCTGELVRVHLIEKQALRRRGHDPWDERSWVWGCGGEWPGLMGHHGELDRFKLQVPADRLPPAVLELAHELGYVPYLERRYGYVREAA